jgi:hypothetical protein
MGEKTTYFKFRFLFFLLVFLLVIFTIKESNEEYHKIEKDGVFTIATKSGEGGRKVNFYFYFNDNKYLSSHYATNFTRTNRFFLLNYRNYLAPKRCII